MSKPEVQIAVAQSHASSKPECMPVLETLGRLRAEMQSMRDVTASLQVVRAKLLASGSNAETTASDPAVKR
jgi:hypothetical protein